MPQLRPFAAADLDAVLEIWLAANLQAHSFIPAAYWHNAAPEVRQQLPQAEVYVLVQAAQIGGFIGLVPDGEGAGAYIAGLFVRPEAQSQGFGRLLLNRAKQAHPQLTLKVYQQNLRACQFYQREGFRQADADLDAETGQRELLMLWP